MSLRRWNRGEEVLLKNLFPGDLSSILFATLLEEIRIQNALEKHALKFGIRLLDTILTKPIMTFSVLFTKTILRKVFK